MGFLFDFRRPRTALQAILFYVGHVVAVAVGSAIAGMVAVEYASKANMHAVAGSAGHLFAIVYVVVLCVRIVMQRELPPLYYASVALALPAAYLLGGIGGLIIPAILITRPGAGVSALQTAAPSAPSTPVRTRMPRGQFGRRSFGN